MSTASRANPFLNITERAVWGPGTLEMALPLVEAVKIRPGMRVLEVGAGSGQVAAILAAHWDVSVAALEPWEGGQEIQARAAAAGVGQRVLGLKLKAQDLGIVADGTFDAVISIGSFEIIGDERPQALEQMVRVAKPGARVGIAEPMCLPVPIPPEVLELDRRAGAQWHDYHFRTVEWNRALFERHGLTVGASDAYYFPDAYSWWLDYAAARKVPPAEHELIRADGGRWLSLGLVVGQKARESSRPLGVTR
jgi:cyclopropane fatty-acyl-phospholipid synthase-like methyltransferase